MMIVLTSKAEMLEKEKSNPSNTHDILHELWWERLRARRNLEAKEVSELSELTRSLSAVTGEQLHLKG